MKTLMASLLESTVSPEKQPIDRNANKQPAISPRNRRGAAAHDSESDNPEQSKD